MRDDDITFENLDERLEEASKVKFEEDLDLDSKIMFLALIHKSNIPRFRAELKAMGVTDPIEALYRGAWMVSKPEYHRSVVKRVDEMLEAAKTPC